MGDLKGWLLGVREKSRQIGALAFRRTEIKREEWRRLSEDDPILSSAPFNSALERVYDEQDDCTSFWRRTVLMDLDDPLDNESIFVDFQPLYEAIHIYGCLNKGEELRSTYEADRRKQMDLLLPSYLNLDDNGKQLNDLLADVAGFSIIERGTSAKTQNFRSMSEIEGIWDVMCARVIELITDTVGKITEPRVLLMVKDSVMLFMQTVQVICPVKQNSSFPEIRLLS